MAGYPAGHDAQTGDADLMSRDERAATVTRRSRLGCTSSAPSRSRAFVADAGQSWGLSEEAIEAAQLATSELVSNSVEHALSAVEITLELEDEYLRIAVRDYSTALPVRRSPGAGGARGRGIALVVALAQDWGVELHEDGKTVWLLLPATPEGVGPSVLERPQVVEVSEHFTE